MEEDKIKVENAWAWPVCENVYQMTKKCRGQVLIISNENFKSLSKRDGSSKDVENLKSLFTQLHFDCHVCKDLKALAMDDKLQRFAQKVEHREAEMGVIIVLSHGGEDGICGYDENFLKTEDILKRFTGDNCPGLLNKPKLFIFQSCRGIERDRGTKVKTDDPKEEETAIWKDMFVIRPCAPGLVALRDEIKGSLLVQTLCKVFSQRSWELDLVDLVNQVTKDILEAKPRKEVTHSGKLEPMRQCVSYESIGFYKRLFFNPGLFLDAKRLLWGPQLMHTTNISLIVCFRNVCGGFSLLRCNFNF